MLQRSVLITGASSGLGAALSVEYANSVTKLFLFGREQERLNRVANLCKQKGAIVEPYIADVRDKDTMKEKIEVICTRDPLDIVIPCAGISAGTAKGVETISQIEEIFDTNLYGTLNVIMPAISSMVENKSGSIILISSMAGLIGLSSAPSYSSSKAAVKILGDALRVQLKQYNINVSVVIAGYIDTPMTKVNNFPMPFMVSAKDAAKIIIQKAQKGSGIIVFPFLYYLVLKILNLLPYRIVDYINTKLPAKSSLKLSTQDD